MVIEWLDKHFAQNVSLENALIVKERKFNYLKKYGLIEGNVILIYNWFRYDEYFPEITNVDF